MSEDAKMLLYIFLGAFALGAAILWVTDYLYTMSTGKPASDRVHESKERAKQPLTQGQFRFRFGFYSISLIFWICGLIFSKDFSGFRKIVAIAWIISFGWSLTDLVRRKRREDSITLHSSDAAT